MIRIHVLSKSLQYVKIDFLLILLLTYRHEIYGQNKGLILKKVEQLIQNFKNLILSRLTVYRAAGHKVIPKQLIQFNSVDGE